jgi:hypothetical protein
MDRVHASVDRPGALGPPWTNGGTDRGGAGAWRRAHRSSASGLFGAPNLTGGGATESGAHGELDKGLAGAQAALRRPSDGGAKPEAVALSERKARARREAKGAWERCGELRG